jgi:hypothetical protein
MPESLFSAEQRAEIRKLARSAAASVQNIPWDDAKDQSQGASNMDARIARYAASHEQ